MIELALSVLVLLCASALASGTEVALFSVPYGMVLSSVSQKKRGALALQRIKDDMARPIMTIVIINNISNIVGSIVIGAMAARMLDSSQLGLFSAGLTFLVIVYAEIIPKTVGDRFCTSIALNMATPVLLLTRFITPLIVLIELLIKPFSSPGRAVRVSEEEITALTRLGQRTGAIEADESELIQRVFRLNDVSAQNIMTPFARVDALDGRLTLDEVREVLMTVTHTRLPVHEGSLNKVTGVVHLRDMLQALSNGQDMLPVQALAKEATFIPDSAVGDDLLRHFQHTKQHLAIVVDAFGTVLGVLTLEDVLEELVGEIVDETDIEPEIERVSKTEILVDASTDVSQINELFQMKMSAEGRIGEQIIEELGRIPREGEVLQLHGMTVTIDEATPRMVKRVRLNKGP